MGRESAASARWNDTGHTMPNWPSTVSTTVANETMIFRCANAPVLARNRWYLATRTMRPAMSSSTSARRDMLAAEDSLRPVPEPGQAVVPRPSREAPKTFQDNVSHRDQEILHKLTLSP